MELHSFEEILKSLPHRKTPTLFVFDVDLVITMARDPVFHPNNYFRHKQSITHLMSVLDEGQDEIMFSIIAAHPERVLVEAMFPQLLKAIYAHGHKALALTAQLTVPYEGVNIIQRRLDELSGFGIDFASSFPHVAPFEFINGIKNFGTLPYYTQGIVFSNGLINPKGAILKTFFETISYQPEAIVFVDDTLDNVHSVREIMEASQIPCESYHYKGIYNLDIPVLDVEETKMAWNDAIKRALLICEKLSSLD